MSHSAKKWGTLCLKECNFYHSPRPGKLGDIVRPGSPWRASFQVHANHLRVRGIVGPFEQLFDQFRATFAYCHRAQRPITGMAVEPSISSKIEAVYVMGGAVGVGGNILDFDDAVAEFNIWFDPVAAQQVLASDLNVTLVPLDATNDVPITPYFYDVFSSDMAGIGGGLIAGYTAANPFAGGVYHWDDLTAAVLLDNSLVEYDDRRIAVIVEGDEQGKAVESPEGYPMRVAVSADQAAFERVFYEALAGEADPDVAAWDPDARVTFDGEACTYTGPDPLPPHLEVLIENSSEESALGVLVVEYKDGTTQEQIQAFSESNLTTPPPFFTILGIAPLPYRTSSVWSYEPSAKATLLCVISISEAIELAGVRIAS